MAAGRSRSGSSSRGATTGQGAKVLREGLAPLPSLEVHAPASDRADEISGWLGTFRERLRMARSDERPQVAPTIQQLEARHVMRRAEPA